MCNIIYCQGVLGPKPDNINTCMVMNSTLTYPSLVGIFCWKESGHVGPIPFIAVYRGSSKQEVALTMLKEVYKECPDWLIKYPKVKGHYAYPAYYYYYEAGQYISCGQKGLE